MAIKLLPIFALLCLAAVLIHAEEEHKPPHHGLVKRSGWFKRPGSPTWRKTLKDDVGQQIDYTENEHTGHRTSGYLALGKNSRQSPPRNGQPHSGGEASSSQKKKKGKKGH